MPYTPVTFGAFAGAARGALVRTGPPYADARLGRGARRGVRGCRRLEARALLPARRRGHALRRSRANAARCAKPSGCSTPARSARSKSSARTPRNSSIGSTSTTLRSLAPGRCRYALLLSEAGFVLDDGIVARLSHDRFHVTTTTGGAAAVLHHMEDYLQTEFPDLRVWLTSITEQWAVIAVQGPRARDVLSRRWWTASISPTHAAYERARMHAFAACRRDCSASASPASSVTRSTCRRIMRSRCGTRCWRQARRSASRRTAPRRCTCCGREGLHHRRPGNRRHGDAGRSWAGLDDRQGESATLSASARCNCQICGGPDRRQLVGLRTVDPRTVLEEGAQLVADAQPPVAGTCDLGLLVRRRCNARSRWRCCPADAPASAARCRPCRRTAPLTCGWWTRPSIERIRDLYAAGSLHRFQSVRAHASIPSASTCTDASLTLLPPATRLSVRAGTAAAATLGAALGVLLGTVPCRAVTARDRTALWLGPDEWLVLAPATRNAPGAARDGIARRCAGQRRRCFASPCRA